MQACNTRKRDVQKVPELGQSLRTTNYRRARPDPPHMTGQGSLGLVKLARGVGHVIMSPPAADIKTDESASSFLSSSFSS